MNPTADPTATKRFGLLNGKSSSKHIALLVFVLLASLASQFYDDLSGAAFYGVAIKALLGTATLATMYILGSRSRNALEAEVLSTLDQAEDVLNKIDEELNKEKAKHAIRIHLRALALNESALNHLSILVANLTNALGLNEAQVSVMKASIDNFKSEIKRLSEETNRGIQNESGCLSAEEVASLRSALDREAEASINLLTSARESRRKTRNVLNMPDVTIE